MEQPKTHTLLRNSQVRNRESLTSSQKLNMKQMNNQQIQKYHFNYQNKITNNNSKQQIPLQQQQISSNDRINKFVENKLIIINNNRYLNERRQNIFICTSLPHNTRPKYSSTFKQTKQIKQTKYININNNSNISSINMSNNNNIIKANNKHINNMNNNINNNNNNKRNINKQPQLQQNTLNLKRNIDICLYNLTDKLKQIKNKQSNQYNQRPSINQLRSNRYLTDKNIYRIQPNLVQKYVENVYKEYQIPDPFMNNYQNVQNIVNINNQQKQHQQQRVTYDIPLKNYYTNKINTLDQNYISKPSSVIQINKQSQFQYNHQPYINNNNYSIHNISNISNISNIHNISNISHLNNPNNFKPTNKLLYSGRKNNHILQKQRRKHKKNKKTFLNITLSKQKNIFDDKNYVSPSKQIKKQLNQSQKQLKQLSRKSNSRKKIKQIKQNISNWKDSQNLYVERYSYLSSPYQMISQRNQINNRNNKINQNREEIMNVQKVSSHRQISQSNLHYIIESNNSNNVMNQSNDNKIHIKVRPFQQLMKVSVPLQSPLNNNTINQSISLIPNTTLGSFNHTNLTNILQSKYNCHSTFISQDGQILEQFRFCILCENAILSANIQKHQEKCIGWVNQNKNKYYTFKQLYLIRSQKELKNIVQDKILSIKQRMFQRIKDIQQKQQQFNNNRLNNSKNNSKNTQLLNRSYSQHANNSILDSIKNYLSNFTQKQSNQQQNQQQNSLFQNNNQLIIQKSSLQMNKSFKQIQKNYSNLFNLLMQDANKLHWFLKLLQNYTRYLQIVSLNNMNTSKINNSTKSNQINLNSNLNDIQNIHINMNETNLQNIKKNNYESTYYQQYYSQNSNGHIENVNKTVSEFNNENVFIDRRNSK